MKKLLVAPLALSAFVLVAAPAVGGGAEDVKVILKESAPAFHGNVKSDEPECEEKRAVFLYRVKNGADKLLGNDNTNGQGQWEILEGDQFTLKSGAYYAQAPALGLESGVNCKKDKSPTLTVD